MSENQKQEKMCYTQLNKIKEKKARIQFDMNELQQVEEAVPMDVSTLVCLSQDSFEGWLFVVLIIVMVMGCNC